MKTQEILSTIKSQFLEKTKEGEYQVNHPEIALFHLFQLFARQRLSLTQLEELSFSVQKEEKPLKKELLTRLVLFLPGMLESNFYHDSESTRNISPNEISTNTFLGYWTVISYMNEDQNLLPEDQLLKNKFTHLIKHTQPHKLNLRFQDLQNANLSYVELEDVDFSYCNLNGATLLHAKVPRSVLLNADLEKANLNNCDLSHSYLSFSNFRQAHLLEADLTKCTLHGANFEEADLTQAILRQANLDQANFCKTTLTMANLEESQLDNTDMCQADLSKANLRKSTIVASSFKRAVLYQTNFSEARIQDTDWNIETMSKADFRGVQLDSQMHNFLKRQGAFVQE